MEKLQKIGCVILFNEVRRILLGISVKNEEREMDYKLITSELTRFPVSGYLYHFPWPYKLKAFEKDLATFEVEGLTHACLETRPDGLQLRSDNELQRQQLERIASFHTVLIKHGDMTKRLWTAQATLERSSPLLRRHKDRKEIDTALNQIQEIPLEKREKHYSLHELHSYKGKYYPQLVRPLITRLLRPGERLLDPFCGCGTTLIEAHFSGVASVGVDLNPIAYFVTHARTSCMKADLNELSKQTDKLLQICGKKKQVIQYRDLTEYLSTTDLEWRKSITNLVPHASIWFSKGALEQLVIIHSLIQQVEDEKVKDFFLLTLSSIVKRVSNWDLKQVRQGLLETPRENVNVFEVFERQLKRYFLIVYVYHKMRQSLRLSTDVIPEAYSHDSRHLEFLKDNSFDAIVTSPPYATALPYLDTDRLPMYVLGLLKPEKMKDLKELMIGERDIGLRRRDELEKEFLDHYDKLDLPGKEIVKSILIANKREKVGFRRRNLPSTLYRYLIGMKECIAEMNRLLRHGGYCCIIIGNNQTKIGGKETIWINTHDILKKMVLQEGMELKKTMIMAPTSAYMVHADNMIRNEYILLFRKSC
jgi:site-specific DNA-methyltransferase (cytosine-N4-specific)